MTEALARFAGHQVDTPALVVDAGALAANLAAMAARCAAGGMALRPHAKTHKCPEVARRQLATGATGLSVATLGEAEVFADAGIDDLFVAYPLWAGSDTGRRLEALAGRCRLSVGADSAAGLSRLAVAARLAGRCSVTIEVDCGLGRSGTAPAQAGPLARAAADLGFEVRGVFTFPGHAYAPGRGGAAAADERRALSAARRSVEAAGLACPVASGGSTPSAGSAQGPVPDELRPGVYAFGDAQQVVLGVSTIDQVALAALATVVSAPTPERVVLDAGSKVLGPDRPDWMPGYGLLPDLPGAVVAGLWEHHAVVDVSAVPSSQRPRLGDPVVVVPNHVCTAVNLSSTLWVAEDGRVVERWPVAARQRNR